MKTESKIKEAIEYLENIHHPSPNMGYEKAGAIAALKWVLSKEKGLPVWIGTR